jgi:hypothetical protein
MSEDIILQLGDLVAQRRGERSFGRIDTQTLTFGGESHIESREPVD